MVMRHPRWWLVFVLGTLMAVPVIRHLRRPVDQRTASPALGTAGARSTSRSDLERVVAEGKEQLRRDPENAQAAVLLADALLRQTRVKNDPALAGLAEQALRQVLGADSDSYEARRMLATVLLSQHRFREAISEATRASILRPGDEWNDGIVGDAHLELAEYDEAFEAFDRMMARRPSAAAYARVSYARELQGDLDAAIQLMSMAREATSPQDPEAQAWHDTQLGHLYIERGRLADARRHFERAAFVFPEHPFAVEGLARVRIEEGRP